MTFMSEEDPPTRLASKKMLMKALKAKVKERKSTPAPPTKGDGRKRFVLSPMPEDKQLRKRIDFGSEDSSPVGSPKRKGSIFSDNLQHGMEVVAALECSTPPPHDKDETHEALNTVSKEIQFSDQNSGQATGDGLKDEEVPDKRTPLGLQQVLASANALGSLEGGVVNLPKMGLGTNPLLKSDLVPFRKENSRGTLAVEALMQPRMSEIIHIASLNSAETLDVLAAQPLIPAGPPEVENMAIETRPSQVSWLEPTKPSTPPAPIVSIEEFPPLEKGRTLKIRDTFELGMSSREGGFGWDEAEVGQRGAPRSEHNRKPAPDEWSRGR